ncbi:MAG: hypothetical protein KGL53_09675, partial [Elusimicrobia bacterium]|nr:hypothetical protein [Elusimicrobiota bacterium]
AAADPAFFRKALLRVMEELRAWQRTPRSAKALSAPSVSAQLRVREAYKARLRGAAAEYLAGRGLDPRTVVTSGTSLRSLMGILFSGGMQASNPYSGFKGESAEYWGGYGLDVGAQYGALRGTQRNEPGVMLLIHNPADPIKVVGGETLSRRPTTARDILAAVVTDGESSVVVPGPALASLSESSERWKESVKAAAQRGSLAPFDAWEKVRDSLEPGR